MTNFIISNRKNNVFKPPSSLLLLLSASSPSPSLGSGTSFFLRPRKSLRVLQSPVAQDSESHLRGFDQEGCANINEQ